ncbi:COG3650 family protein [Qipengyuania soli]|uniref:Uncharacterized protein n=1 Tax=Qipengyuania soli TaxID=2782568 RepID=A0A7S8F4M2_9SPHN|nr:hypothetical protein [Qipengyuania soli]QPC99071.1 hypothetical protein IRL76_00315 [Qipengyuania soli]
MRLPNFAILLASASLASCQSAGSEGNGGPTPAFDGISVTETVKFTGTEPFWGGSIATNVANYSTPDDPGGTSFPVERFAGLNGVSFSGKLGDATFDLMVTPGKCSDGMSDLTYPFVATLMIGSEKREGCAWTDKQPFTGGEAA